MEAKATKYFIWDCLTISNFVHLVFLYHEPWTISITTEFIIFILNTITHCPELALNTAEILYAQQYLRQHNAFDIFHFPFSCGQRYQQVNQINGKTLWNLLFFFLNETTNVTNEHIHHTQKWNFVGVEKGFHMCYALTVGTSSTYSCCSSWYHVIWIVLCKSHDEIENIC